MKSLRIAFIVFIVLVSVISVREIMFLKQKEQAVDLYAEQQIKHLENINKMNKIYNELYESYSEIYLKYMELGRDYESLEDGLDVLSGWQKFEVTGYTSLDSGCNNISAIGMDIEKWSIYFDFVAVDPSVIPLGSVVLMKLDNGIIPLLAVDTGSDIKGNRLDIYFVNNLENAYNFGRKYEVEALVLKGEI